MSRNPLKLTAGGNLPPQPAFSIRFIGPRVWDCADLLVPEGGTVHFFGRRAGA
jgi:hypothetical protein